MFSSETGVQPIAGGQGHQHESEDDMKVVDAIRHPEATPKFTYQPNSPHAKVPGPHQVSLGITAKDLGASETEVASETEDDGKEDEGGESDESGESEDQEKDGCVG